MNGSNFEIIENNISQAFRQQSEVQRILRTKQTYNNALEQMKKICHSLKTSSSLFFSSSPNLREKEEKWIGRFPGLTFLTYSKFSPQVVEERKQY